MRKELIENNPLLKLILEFSILNPGYCNSLDQQKNMPLANS